MPEQLRKMLRLEINIPNMIAIAGVLITLAAGWTQVKADNNRNSEDIVRLEDALEKRIEKIETDQDERRTRDLDTIRVLAEMRADLRYLRQAVERRMNKSLP